MPSSAKALDRSVRVKDVIFPLGLILPTMHLSTLGVYCNIQWEIKPFSHKYCKLRREMVSR
jgi:hypothetical protein